MTTSKPTYKATYRVDGSVTVTVYGPDRLTLGLRLTETLKEMQLDKSTWTLVYVERS